MSMGTSEERQVSKDSQWISIHDRMPNEYEEVMTFNPTGPYQTVAFWDGREWSSGDARADAYDKLDPDGISHWMLLPPPPAERETKPRSGK